MIPRTTRRRFERSDEQWRGGVSFSSMSRKSILGLLKGGDRRSIGRADEVAAAVHKHLAMFSELIQGVGGRAGILLSPSYFPSSQQLLARDSALERSNQRR